MDNKLWPWETVAYQIYPRSFKDSSGNGVGDLKGIQEKLDYLANLGVSAVWLSPFYPSPMADFGYDVSDYCDVDPLFGTLDDFDALLEVAHKKGIKMIIDFVPNHTSDKHPWFLESQSNRNNSKRDWYVWRDPAPDGGVPNNWLSVFGGSAWEYDEPSGQYYLHSFVKEQPDLNWYNPEVQNAVKEAMRFWLQKGVDGFRLDAVYHMGKDQEFRDNPVNPNYVEGDDPYHAFIPSNSKKIEDIFDFLGQIVGVLKSYSGHRFMISEAYPSEHENELREYKYFYENLDVRYASPFNFCLAKIEEWEAPVVKQHVDKFNAHINGRPIPAYVLSNHDIHRVATRFGPEQARVAAMLLLALPGMPFIYQGDELGMEDVPVPPDKIQDPFGINVKGYSRDPARTPMQWSAAPHAGFSKAEPWLPVGENYKELNAEAELKDPRSMLSLYKALIKLRNNSPALQSGVYVPAECGNENVFTFRREGADGNFNIFLNFTASQQQIPATGGEPLITTYMDSDSIKGALRPNEGIIFKQED